MRNYLIAVVLAFLLWLWPEALGFAVFAMLAPPLCDSSCCATCTIFTDDFATDRTGTDYSIRSGSWSVSGGLLSCTSASGLLRCETAVTAGLNGVYAFANCTCQTTSDIARLIIAYVDDNNYWFAEVQPGASNGTLKLFQRSGGTNTQQGSTETINGFQATEQVSLSLCYAAGVVRAYALASGPQNAGVHVSATITIASTKCGLGTGSGSSSVSFDDFTFSKHDIDDPACPYCNLPCNPCNDTFPTELEVTLPTNLFTGTADEFFDCVTDDCCTALNGQTFVLPQTPSGFAYSGCQAITECLFYKSPVTFCSTDCGSGDATTYLYAWFVQTPFASTHDLWVVLQTYQPSVGGRYLFFKLSGVTSGITCTGNSWSVPFNSSATTGCVGSDSCTRNASPDNIEVVA